MTCVRSSSWEEAESKVEPQLSDSYPLLTQRWSLCLTISFRGDGTVTGLSLCPGPRTLLDYDREERA